MVFGKVFEVEEKVVDFIRLYWSFFREFEDVYIGVRYELWCYYCEDVEEFMEFVREVRDFVEGLVDEFERKSY